MKQTSIQFKRLEKQILRILNSALINEIYDQNFKHIVFTALKLSNDKSWLKVYVDQYDKTNILNTIEKLNYSAKAFQKILVQKLNIYKIPKIYFLADEILENAAKIEALINQSLKLKKK